MRYTVPSGLSYYLISETEMLRYTGRLPHQSKYARYKGDVFCYKKKNLNAYMDFKKSPHYFKGWCRMQPHEVKLKKRDLKRLKATFELDQLTKASEREYYGFL
jgi:hypothetical protein